MGGLIRAEFRKVLTTNLWWALLIGAAALAFGWSAVAGLATTGIADGLRVQDLLQASGDRLSDLPLAAFALSRGINIATLFPMLFGALGLANELHTRTITTSFLTASSRSALLGAKAVVYALWGVIFGVVIAGLGILGTIVGADGRYLPSGTGFLVVFAGGVLASVLWTLLGLGVGALIGRPLGVVLLLVVYTVAAEPVFAVYLHNHVAGVLPNGSADGITGATAAQLVIDQLQTHSTTPLQQAVGTDRWNEFLAVVRALADGIGAFDWWVSGLIFLGWTAVLFVLGMARNRTRDIT